MPGKPDNRDPDPGGSEEDNEMEDNENEDAAPVPEQKSPKGRCLRWTVGTITVAVGIVAALLAVDSGPMLLDLIDGQFGVDPDLLDSIGMDGVILFRQHDTNNDGYLSLEEFEPLAHRLRDVNMISEDDSLPTTKETYEYEVPIQSTDSIITVESHFQPLLIETMTKEMDVPLGKSELDPLWGLKKWKEPVLKTKNFATKDFAAFLPPDDSYMQELGKVYYLLAPPPEMYRGPSLSSGRYYPPKLHHPAEILIHQLLVMLHPRPFVLMRFAPQGSVAAVRAESEHFLDIYFRIHGEFQLNEPPFYPFWFTPAQFQGRLIISKDAEHVLYFKLRVPTEKQLNVDMEWLNAPKSQENMEVDIGFIPEMELCSTSRSAPVPEEFMSNPEGAILPPEDDMEEGVSHMEWRDQIEASAVLRKMEVQMYPFKEVPYFNLTEAFQKAEEVNKPVHSIALWGALDDQSC